MSPFHSKWSHLFDLSFVTCCHTLLELSTHQVSSMAPWSLWADCNLRLTWLLVALPQRGHLHLNSFYLIKITDVDIPNHSFLFISKFTSVMYTIDIDTICKFCMGFSKHPNTEPRFYIFPFAAILCRSQSGGKIKIYTLTTWLTPAQGSVKWGKSFWAIFHLSKPCRTFPICPVSACSLLTEDRLARLQLRT